MNEDPVLFLSLELHENYNALQNFLNGIIPNRSKRRNGGSKNTTKQNLLIKQDFKCADCQKPFEPGLDGKYKSATKDHVIPFRYGSNFAMNAEFVCMRCNGNRDKDPLPYILKFFGTIDIT